MQVTYRSKGCLDKVGCLFSLGILPLVLRAQRRRMPAQLTEEAMVLHDGTRVPWQAFKQLKKTDVYLERRYIGTRIELTHDGGTVIVPTDRVEQPNEVQAFIMNHLPPHVRGA